MLRTALHRSVDFVTDHTRITLLVMVVLSGVVIAGIPQFDMSSEASGTAADFGHLDRVQSQQYIGDNYATGDGDNRSISIVYVRDQEGNVLSRASLLEGLGYQQEIRNNESVGATLHGDGILGFENLVATRAAGDRTADLSSQIAALESASSEEVQQLVETTIAEDPRAERFLPTDHEGTTAHDRRLLVVLDGETAEETQSAATRAIYEAADERDGYFTFGEHANAAYQAHFTGEMIELVLPLALLGILLVLGFAYRDLVDVIVGMTGVVLSVLWMFGLLGWLGVSAGLVIIAPLVLVSGLSIDFGFHVFNRYREQREAGAKRAPRDGERGAETTREQDDSIRAPMNRGVRLVVTALVLVTVTAAIGFLSNLANPLPMIRNLGIAITLGVASAFLIFVTIVPALKIGIDGLLERVGFDRHKQALGHGTYLRPLLAKTVGLARRAAPVVLILAIVVGAAGGLAWTALEEESFQQGDGDVAEWKQNLPGPIGWEKDPLMDRLQHVQDIYEPASADAAFTSRILIEGDVTDPATLEAIDAGMAEIDDAGLLFDQPGERTVVSPLTAMHAVAERDGEFAAALEAADTDGDGVPDRNLEALYDRLYEADSDLASRVLERSGGKYRSALLTLSLNANYADAKSVVASLETGAGTIEDGSETLTATVAGDLAVNQAVLGDLVDGILLTMVIALAAILLTLTAVFRVMHGSATLGAVVAIPVALVVGIVIGGMYLLEIPLTLLTALLMSLVVGLGVDYNIHIGDRFADERRDGNSTLESLEAAITGTGGALLGSTLTTAGAFATIALVPHPQLRSFGAIVVIALVTAFLVSLLVLPSLLVLWERYVPASVSVGEETAAANEPVPQD